MTNRCLSHMSECTHVSLSPMSAAMHYKLNRFIMLKRFSVPFTGI